MFVRYGLKSVRMDDIAERLGMSKRTIYENFDGGREALIKECVEYYYISQIKNNEIKTQKATNIIEEFMIIMNEYDKDAQANANFKADLMRFYPAIYKEVVDRHKQEDIDRFREGLCKGIEDGVIIPSLNIDFAVLVLIDLIGTIINNLTSYKENNISMEEALKYTIMYFFRSISTARGMRIVDGLMEKYTGKREQEEIK